MPATGTSSRSTRSPLEDPAADSPDAARARCASWMGRRSLHVDALPLARERSPALQSGNSSSRYSARPCTTAVHPLHRSGQRRRAQRMATDRRHPQPPEAPQPPNSPRRDLRAAWTGRTRPRGQITGGRYERTRQRDRARSAPSNPFSRRPRRISTAVGGPSMPELYVGNTVTSDDRDGLASHARYAGIRAHERPLRR